MSPALSGPELAVVALGAWHGLNPGMGWLFAVALGLQEQRGAAVWRALPPLALGHGVAIGAAVLLGAAAGLVVSPIGLRWAVAGFLVTFGVYRLVRARHPKWRGMRVGFRDLTVWSTLMASAHGAGLMVLPFVVGGMTHGGTHAHAVTPDMAGVATLLHTGGYLAVTGLLALIVFRWVGVSRLKRVWVNLDLVWALALIATGIATPLF
ncbi:MAG: hypothetical protein ACM3NS_10915 [Deltaproteobacteria bacterium]